MSDLIAKVTDKRDLTDAESETLKFLCSGLPIKSVADERHVSIHTIKRQMESIYRKFAVHNIGAVVAMAVALNVVTITLRECGKDGLVCLFLVFLTLSQLGGVNANRVRGRVRMPRPTVSRTTRLGSRIKKDFA